MMNAGPEAGVIPDRSAGLATAREQVLRFAAVGVVGTAIHYGVLIAMVELVGTGPVVGTCAGFMVAAFFAFLLNSRYTFKAKIDLRAGLLKNYSSLAVGLGINMGTVALLTWLKVPYIAAQAAATVLAFIWNFLASKFFVFRT